MIGNLKVSVIIPCYNEELTIGKVVRDFIRVYPEVTVYVYDNNSVDNTIEEAKSAGAIIGKELQKGKANVVRRMFREVEADIYVMVDGDDTYPAEALPAMLELIVKNQADVVVGDRLSNKSYAKENKRMFHDFGNNLTKRLINTAFGARIPDVMSGYRVMTKRFVKNFPVISNQFELETEMTIFSLHNNLHIEHYPITYRDRPENSFSKLNTYSDGIKVIATIFNLIRHYKPLFFFGALSILFLCTSIILGIPVLIEYFTYSYVYKVPTTIVSSAFLILSVLSLGIGILLDTITYGLRIQFELKNKN